MSERSQPKRDPDADAFEQAVGPSRITSLSKNPQAYNSRLKAFKQHNTMDDASFISCVEKVLERANVDASAAAGLAEAVGLVYLHTCDDKLLIKMGENYVSWHPLIEYLRTRDAATPADWQNEQRLQCLIDSATRIVWKRWREEDHYYSTEDAVQDALLKVITDIRADRLTYNYEGDFPSWLASVAIRNLLARTRRRKEGTVLVDMDQADAAAAKDESQEIEYLDFVLTWRERYLLVRSYFRESSWPELEEEFEDVLNRPDPDGDPQEQQPAGGTGGQAVVSSTDIRRYRQRLYALHYVLDLVPMGAPDAPFDASVLAWVKAKTSIAGKNSKEDEKAVPTLRGLANLGRASRKDGTLAWAYAAKLFADHLLPTETIREAVKTGFLDMWHQLKLAAEVHSYERLDRACKLIDSAPHREEVRQLRARLTGKHVRFLLAPFWYLGGLRKAKAVDAVATLNSVPPESEVVGEVYQGLGFPRQVTGRHP